MGSLEQASPVLVQKIIFLGQSLVGYSQYWARTLYYWCSSGQLWHTSTQYWARLYQCWTSTGTGIISTDPVIFQYGPEKNILGQVCVRPGQYFFSTRGGIIVNKQNVSEEIYVDDSNFTITGSSWVEVEMIAKSELLNLA